MTKISYTKTRRSRWLCDVLEEMRGCDKSKNFAHMGNLIEEAQRLANNMEDALGFERQVDEIMSDFDKLKGMHREVFSVMNELFPELFSNKGYNKYRRLK